MKRRDEKSLTVLNPWQANFSGKKISDFDKKRKGKAGKGKEAVPGLWAKKTKGETRRGEMRAF